LRAISLTRPWPFAFIHLNKRIENRSWQPLPQFIGPLIALHAAKSWSEDDRRFIQERTSLIVPDKKNSPHSEIFAVCRIVKIYPIDSLFTPPQDQEEWFFGPYGWLLEDYKTLSEPVPCKGALGFWQIPGEVESRITLDILNPLTYKSE
jgi:hypothetical protein